MNDENPYAGIGEICNNGWDQIIPTQPLTMNTVKRFLDYLDDQCKEERVRPTYHPAWCSKCGLRGMSTVGGDQAEWHGCKP